MSRAVGIIVTAAFLWMAGVLPLCAQETSDSLSGERSWAVGLGPVNLLDTYLSPEKYSGSELIYLSQRISRWRKHQDWWWHTTSVTSVPYASPRADNSNYIGLRSSFCLALQRLWHCGGSWRLWAGVQTEAALGFLYSTRNSNNPAQLHANLCVGPAAMADYRLPLTLFGKHISARYEVSLPLFGLTFSPNYGQSYYELFSRGNYDHNIVLTTPFSSPSLRQQLSLAMAFRRTTLRVGYMGDYQQYEVNSLKYHSYSHSFLLGVTRLLFRK